MALSEALGNRGHATPWHQQGCIKLDWERWHPAGEAHFRDAGETPALPAGNGNRA